MLAFYLSLLDTESEKETFTALYRHYEGAMYHVAYDIVRDQYLAEDAVHNAFIKLTRYLPKISDVTCHKTRALTVIIVKNAAIDLYRKRAEHHEVFEDALSPEREDTDDLPLDKVIEAEYLEQLTNGLKQLNPDHLDIFTLRFLHGYSGDEIADILSISPGAARQRVSRAKKAVIKLLEEMNPNADQLYAKSSNP